MRTVKPTFFQILLLSVLCITLGGVITGCSNSDCIIKPQLHLADRKTQDGKIYYLYTRTSGFQEKQVFFEVYDEEPVFDKCNKALIKPFFEIAHDHERFVKTVILNANSESYDDRLKILYTLDQHAGYSSTNDVRFQK